MSPAQGFLRRSIIRATWHKQYQNSAFTKLFVVSRPDPLWLPVLQNEMDTYGDIVVLSHLEENEGNAWHIKTIMFFKHMLKTGKKWKYISKIDDDSFLDANALYNDYILPHIHAKTPNVVMGRWLTEKYEPGYPGGQFYTLSWDLMETLCDTFEQNPNTGEYEDLLIGRLMVEAQVNYTAIKLDNDIAFDYDMQSTNTSAWGHNVTKQSLNPHKMKSDKEYLEVAEYMLRWQQMKGNDSLGGMDW